MWTRDMRRSLHREEGQALVLVCVLLLVLSLAVVSTVQLGQTLDERVRLQNTADAAAYSMAAMEARAFNFYAFANRAQVSHYVSAMMGQSVISFWYGTEVFFVDGLGMVESTLGRCRSGGEGVQAFCAAAAVVPGVGAFIQILSTLTGAVRGLVELFRSLTRALDPDRLIGRGMIPLHRTMNEVLAGASNAVMVSTLQSISRVTSEVLRHNDSDLDASASVAATSPINECLFDRAHMAQASQNPLAPNPLPLRPLDPRKSDETDRVARAKRSMAQIANGTRFGCDEGACDPSFVTRRGFFAMNTSGPGRAIQKLLIPQSGTKGSKWGQTRLLSSGLAKGVINVDGDQRNLIRSHGGAPNAPWGVLAQGDNLGADDVYRIPFENLLGPLLGTDCSPDADRTRSMQECWGDAGFDARNAYPFRNMLKGSVWALHPDDPVIPSDVQGPDRRGGVHWRVAAEGDGNEGRPGWKAPLGADNPYAHLGLNQVRKRVLKTFSVTLYVANVRGIWDGNHPWPGLVPFPHFEPGAYAETCESGRGTPGETAATHMAQFNQPSSWVMLSKKLPSRGWGSNDNPHLQTWARGQTYYHRPGNWQEMPNFFNPYWRARLAPVLLDELPVPAMRQWMEQLPESLRGNTRRVLTH